MTVKLGELLGRLDGGLGRAINNCNLLSLWGQVVDERVGKQTEAVKIVNRTLYVNAASSTWAQELSYLKKEIMEKFNRMAGQELISDIKFKSGGQHGEG